MKIILGSSSPRRNELMKMLNIPFEVAVSTNCEIYDDNKTIYEQCMDIAHQKALNVYNKTSGDRIVIGVDTVVKYNNKIYGKPKDKEDARNMLNALNGECHEVVTGVSIIGCKNTKKFEESVYDVSKVQFDKMSDFEIEKWVFENNVCDMAGGYGIQTEFSKYIKKIDGNYYSIVGLPINVIYQMLKKYVD